MPYLSRYSVLTDDEYLRLYALAMKVGRAELLNKQGAEDVAQDVLLALWLRSLSSQALPIRDRTRWVAKSARYAAIRVLKSRRRELPLSNVRDTVPTSADWKIDLATALSRLPARDQELFKLRYLARMSVCRIATRIGSSESTMRRRLRQLKVVLSRALTTY